MRFMLDTISALRTNNARKIPNYDPSLLEHMRKLLRGLVRSTGKMGVGYLHYIATIPLKPDAINRS